MYCFCCGSCWFPFHDSDRIVSYVLVSICRSGANLTSSAVHKHPELLKFVGSEPERSRDKVVHGAQGNVLKLGHGLAGESLRGGVRSHRI